MLCAKQVLPFWTVKISAVAQRGRLPQLWPFQGYTVALSAILKDEGVTGLFKGAVPVCTGAYITFVVVVYNSRSQVGV
jgi:Mitochondrial carrier protein